VTVRHETILIIEEDDDLRRLLSLALRLGGFATREARDGLEAMSILEQQVRIDAVILDDLLPDIDGLSVRQEIAAHGDLPVIVITESEAPLPGFHPSCVIRKPVVPDEVVVAVVKCLNEAGRITRPRDLSQAPPQSSTPPPPVRRSPSRPGRQRRPPDARCGRPR
jgi:CheY-like chemotaxis protein